MRLSSKIRCKTSHCCNKYWCVSSAWKESFFQARLCKKWGYYKMNPSEWIVLQHCTNVAHTMRLFDKCTKDIVRQQGRISRETCYPLSATVLKSIAQLCPNLQRIRNLCTPSGNCGSTVSRFWKKSSIVLTGRLPRWMRFGKVGIRILSVCAFLATKAWRKLS